MTAERGLTPELLAAYYDRLIREVYEVYYPHGSEQNPHVLTTRSTCCIYCGMPMEHE